MTTTKSRKRRTWALWLLSSLCLFAIRSHAQITLPYERLVCAENNTLLHPEQLSHVFEQLYQLEKDNKGEVRILHIGDSHVQGNYFPHRIRELFYADFGQGNLGLTFPFQVAQTNTPPELKSISKQRWEIRKNTQVVYSEQIGICGRTIGNIAPASAVQMRIPEAFQYYKADEFTVFYNSVNKSSSYVVTDAVGKPLKKLSSTSENGFTADKYRADDLLTEWKLKFQTPRKFQGKCYLHGLYVENGKQNGITYNVAGMNGSQYKHWAASKSLAEESAILKPNLIIVSLGTNDANDWLLSTEVFTSYMDKLVTSLRKANPKADVLLTIPADSWFRQKYVNQHVARIRQAILDYGAKKRIACWDLYAVMGGENAITVWQKEELASKDLVHFTKTGYQLQGELFYEAFINYYKCYVADRSK